MWGQPPSAVRASEARLVFAGARDAAYPIERAAPSNPFCLPAPIRSVPALKSSKIPFASMHLQPLSVFFCSDGDRAVFPICLELSGLVGNQISAANQVLKPIQRPRGHHGPELAINRHRSQQNSARILLPVKDDTALRLFRACRRLGGWPALCARCKGWRFPCTPSFYPGPPPRSLYNRVIFRSGVPVRLIRSSPKDKIVCSSHCRR